MSTATKISAPARVGLHGALSDEYYQQISTFIEKRVGIRLPPNKRSMVEGRLRKRLKAHDLGSIEEYCSLLFEEGALGDELTHLIDCMTTNKTDFFREPAHFDILRDRILPELLSGKAGNNGRTVKVWSAAASIGAEPFTIAMVLDQALRSYPRATYSVLGTDISTDVLRQANRAVYPTEMMAPVPPDFHSRYCMVSRDPDRREIRIVPELRRNVQFKHLNLMDGSYPVEKNIDVIFCRNILIYFSRHIQQQVVGRLVTHLRPGGFLILGHSESMAGGDQPELNQAFPTVFRKKSGNEEQAQWKQKANRRYAS
jgi:chemotaxis protein methyltransferase CheR/two-component system chemotaxis response regulator CheB